MANFYGFARSNYFKVKDPDKFRAEIGDIDGIELYEEKGMFTLLATGVDDGCFPSMFFFAEGDQVPAWIRESKAVRPDSEQSHDYAFFFPELIAEYLADGEVAIFMECGAEKLRYLSGWAYAINNQGESVQVGLNDIYELAKQKFGVEPTRAEY